MNQRRGLTAAVLAAAGGAGLALFGASRVWWVEVVPRPAPLRPEEIAHTGGSLAPLLPALGLVALAGAGSLLATRGSARRLVGALLTVVALGTAITVAGALRGARPLWPAVCLVGAVLIGVAGVLAIRYGGQWPEMGARYRRNQPYVSSAGARPGAGGAAYEDAMAGRDTGTAVRDPVNGGSVRSGAATGSAVPGSPVPGSPVIDSTVSGGPAAGGRGGAATTGEPGAPNSPRLSAAELWDAVDRGDDPTRD
jgi:hypothetical protein